MKPAFLALADGSLFQGRSIGSDGETSGELIFNTAMYGYGEVLSDPSYRRQIVAMTSPHIGNYGITSGMYESDRFQVAGFVIRSLTEIPSTTEPHAVPLRDALQKEGVVAIEGIDVRKLTRRLRTEGTIPAAIVAGKEANIERATALAKSAPSMTGAHLVPEVSTQRPYLIAPHENDSLWLDGGGQTCPEKVHQGGSQARHPVVLFDFGVKRSIIDSLVKRGCAVTVVPHHTPAEEVLKRNPSGVVLSNGPGDPAALKEIADQVKKLMGKLPILGICLGHQILGLAVGAKTIKLPFGHHGVNHPVQDVATQKVEISSHNHGFAVAPETLPKSVRVTHRSLYDGTLEGMSDAKAHWLSVQFHPEAAPGPHDSLHIFDQFFRMMAEKKPHRRDG